MIRIAALAAANLALVAEGGIGSAYAHAFLRRSDPPAGTTVAAPPVQVRIEFTEALEPSFSSIAVFEEAGAEVDRRDMHLAPDNAKSRSLGDRRAENWRGR